MTDLSNDAIVLDDPAGQVIREESPVRDETILMSFDPDEIGFATGIETYEVETLESDPVAEVIEPWHGPALFSIAEIPTDGATDEFFLQSPGLGEIRLGAAGGAAEALSPGRRVLARQPIAKVGRHFLREVRLWFEEDPNVDPQQIKVLLPLLRLHRPARSGCSATCVVSTANAKGVQGDFAVAGLGGGGEQMFTKHLESTYRAEAACKEVAVPADCTIRFGSMILDETPVSYGSRIEIDKVHVKQTVERALPKGLDHCGRIDPVGDREDHFARDNPGGDGDASEHRSGFELENSGFISVGLELGPPPIKMSTKMTRKLSSAYAVTTKLAGGADYRSFAPSSTNPFELCWTVL